MRFSTASLVSTMTCTCSQGRLSRNMAEHCAHACRWKGQGAWQVVKHFLFLLSEHSHNLVAQSPTRPQLQNSQLGPFWEAPIKGQAATPESWP